ncbi:MAG: hypothetical protein ACOYL6_14685 [Bacteriovoracaceae bacterium]
MDLYYTGFKQFKMTEVGLDLNLNREKDLTSNIYWTNINSTEDVKSVSNQFQGSLEKSIGNESFRAGINYWNDPTSHISYTGPGVYWGHEFESENELSLELGSDILNYQSKLTVIEEDEEDETNTQVKVDGRKMTQYHPNIKFAGGLFQNKLMVTSTYSYYLYSNDPKKLVEDGLDSDQNYEATLYTSAGKFINGFLRHEYNFNLNYQLLDTTSIILDAGQAQSAVDQAWSTSFGPTLSQMITNQLLLEMCWNRTVMYGTNYTYYTAGMNYRF